MEHRSRKRRGARLALSLGCLTIFAAFSTLMDDDFNIVGRIDVDTAEEVRKFINSHHGSTSDFGRGVMHELKEALDEDVFSAAGEDVFKRARSAKAAFEQGLSRAKVSKFDKRRTSLVRDIVENKIDPGEVGNQIASGKVADAQPAKDFYLLDIEADGYLLAESVAAYRTDNAFLIEFGEFLTAVEFPISYDRQVWSGWFFSEDKRFQWDTHNDQLVVAGVNQPKLEIPVWLNEPDGFFVSVEALEAWFDLSLSVDVRRQVVTVISEQPLPFQEWRIRTLAKYWHRTTQVPEADVVVPDQYGWLTVPLFNISSYLQLQDQNGIRSNAQSASAVAGMDFLKHSLMYAGSLSQVDHGDDQDEHASHRLTIERAAAKSDSTLFAGANHYAIGDVYQVVSNLVVAGDSGRGLSVRRSVDGNAGNRSRVTIVGDASPGWEVELYRNGTLIEFGTVAADGRYVFPDQDLPFGENIFVARLFGPQGQTREDRQVFWGGGVDLAAGDYDYSVSHIEFDHNFIDGAVDDADLLRASYATDFRASRAWTDDLQAGVAYTRTGLSPQARGGDYVDTNYMSAFSRMKIGRGVLIAEAVKQFDAGYAWSIEYLTGFNGHNVSAAHWSFNDFESPATIHREPLEFLNELSLSGPLNRTLAASYSFRVLQREKLDGTSDIRLFNRLGARFGALSLSNEIEHLAVEGPDMTNGKFKAAGRIGRISVRGQLDYQLSAEPALRQVSASFSWDYSSRLNNNLVITQNLVDDKAFYFTNRLSFRVRDYDISFNVSSDFDEAWQVGLGFNMAIGFDDRQRRFISGQRDLANTGRARMNLFVDENNNGIREPGEAPVEWLKYKSQESFGRAASTVTLNALPRYQPVKIDVREIKLSDPFLVPRAAIYEIYTHAGSDISVDVALVRTGDVEGYIYSGSEKEHAPVRGLNVTLHDKNGKEVAAARSEFDGYYSFTSIPVGNYEIRVVGQMGDPSFTQSFLLEGDAGLVVLDKILLYE
ncbi:MAG: carboxypeptidase-like regulatory domain-containing protein [Gammaproteobacteria bacterium]|nr:carboxypeptidase-like regulatory domain-containing protein [Gammaproteobacteria bacterium]